MNEATLKDLKQFITTTVREEISGVREEVASIREEVAGVRQEVTGVHEEVTGLHKEVASVREDITSLEKRINARFDENDIVQNEILNAIGEVQELQNKAIRRHADTIDNHEHRIVKLEKRTA